MLINPVSWMRPPPPVRRIWRRRTEPAGAVAAPSPLALGEHRSTEAAAPVEPVPEAEGDKGEPTIYETPMLASATLAGLTALRAADAEVAARALLAGAKAHGPIDHAHLKLIFQHLDEIGASDEDRRYVLAHLGDPPDMKDLFASVHDRTTAQESYHLAALMIDPEKPREREWLADLRGKLRALAARFG